MNLAEKLRSQALMAEETKSKAKLANTLDRIKKDAAACAEAGKFELWVWLSSIYYSKKEMFPIIDDLKKEGFNCLLTMEKNNTYYDGYEPDLENVLIISWK
jgi:tRNA G26 N,N-dimethylase Trm1